MTFEITSLTFVFFVFFVSNTYIVSSRRNRITAYQMFFESDTRISRFSCTASESLSAAQSAFDGKGDLSGTEFDFTEEWYKGSGKKGATGVTGKKAKKMERVTGIEPATITLAT